jgi:hypothetical protein
MLRSTKDIRGSDMGGSTMFSNWPGFSASLILNSLCGNVNLLLQRLLQCPKRFRKRGNAEEDCPMSGIKLPCKSLLWLSL